MFGPGGSKKKSWLRDRKYDNLRIKQQSDINIIYNLHNIYN